MKSNKSLTAGVVVITITMAITASWFYTQSNNVVEWTSVDVSGKSRSGEAHLLKMPSGKFVLIDTGFERYAEPDLIPALKAAGVQEIELILITHAHRNHYGALPKVTAKFKVRSVLFNMPDASACERETWAMSCDQTHIDSTFETLSNASKVLPFEHNTTLYTEPNIEIIGLSARSSVDGLSVNEGSDLFMLKHGDVKVLFSGDIALEAESKWLKQENIDISAHAVTAPHHGVKATVSNDFYRLVNPELVTVGVSKSVWMSDRGKETRDYLSSKRIKTYVHGIHGNQSFIITKNKINEK